jgi:NADP-dependent aldehyde dehydrogenase
LPWAIFGRPVRGYKNSLLEAIRMPVHPVLIDGRWRESKSSGTFRADNPATGEPLADEYPVSSWADCDAALAAAVRAHDELGRLPVERLAVFLEDYAGRLEGAAERLVAMAHAETALPAPTRLAQIELPRTTNQLRLAAAAARGRSWAAPTIDTKLNIRSQLASIGPVWVFGPNNFPFAFGSISGGDFAAAIAAGNPVIAKANTSHPGTTRLLGELAQAAADAAGLPPGTVQLLFRTSHADGERLVADPRTGATGYTGSRKAGLALKAAADKAGKPIYLELSSVNPVFMLPGALAERGDKLAEEFAGSCLMGTGQFCTNPGFVVLLAGAETERFLAAVAQRFAAAPADVLLSRGVARSLGEGVQALVAAGAEVVVGGQPAAGPGFRYANTLLRTTGAKFLAKPEDLQSEAFGNASLFVVAESADLAAQLIDLLEGSLTGCFYTDTRGADDALYARLAPRLRPRVGRLLNDKMPTGVAVSPAMNHGGPYPATGHPGFTAVGIPAALRRFARLDCYDNVRPERLPETLRDKNPGGVWRLVDGAWTMADVAR